MTNYPRIDADKPSKIVVSKCCRCGGSGIYGNHGTCYRCGGAGSDPSHREWGYPRSWTEEQCRAHVESRLARNDTARSRKAAKEKAKADAIWSANVEKCPGLPGLRHDFVVFDVFDIPKHQWPETLRLATAWEAQFIREIVSKAFRFAISDKQAALLASIEDKFAERAAKRAAERASAVAAPEGRVQIEGTVLSIKNYESHYGTTTKCLIQCDGYKLFGTVPAAIVADAKVGDVVRLTATVKAKEPGFGTYSRPTGGEIVRAEVAVG